MIKKTAVFLLTCLGVSCVTLAQTNLVISSFNGLSGQLLFNEVENATNYFVLKSTDPVSGWTPAGGGLDHIAPSGSGTISCMVPMTDDTCIFRAGANLATAILLDIEMISIPSNTVLIGDSIDFYFDDEVPTHNVDLDAFYIGKYEVTKAQWDAVSSWASGHGYSLSVGSGKGTNHPIHYVTWYDAAKWCNALSEMEGRTPCYTVSGSVYREGTSNPECEWTANGYRLPTEAEWECASRGGNATGRRFPWWNNDTIDFLRANYYHARYGSWNYDYASGVEDYSYHNLYNDGAAPYTNPVDAFDEYAKNGYDVQDTAGNVSEWCWDWYDSGYYANSPSVNPRGPESGIGRSIRGGSWYDYAYNCRNASRNWGSPSLSDYRLGFRVARTAE